MNVALVQHNQQNTRKYCFAVPDELIPHIKQDTRVVCDTVRGFMPGRIVSEILTGDSATQAIEERGAYMPLRNIVAVVNKVNISDIRIPIRMEMSTPHKFKIVRRESELKAFGCVRTKVVVDDNGILKDGYTAYLVCKNKGMSEIPFAVW